jgi:hypothetical protein
MRPDEFAPGSVANVTSFGFDRVGPPSSLYIQRDDQLLLQVLSSAGTTQFVEFNIRFLRVPEPQGGQPDQGGVGRSPGAIFTRGIIQAQTERVQCGITPSTVNLIKNLGEGYLLSVTAIAEAGTNRGDTFVRVALARGPGTFGIPMRGAFQLLFCDYVTTTTPAGWPGGRILSPLEGPGWVRSVQVGNPIAGGEWAFVTPANRRVAMRSFSAVFAAAVAVANRNINIIVDDGANTVWQDDVSVAVTTGQTVIVSGAQTNAPAGVVTTTLFVVLPPGLMMEPAWRMRSSTGNIQGADQWSSIWLNMEEWIDTL